MSNQSEYDEAVDTEGDEGEEHLEHVRGSDEGEEDHDGESTSVGVILTKSHSVRQYTGERERMWSKPTRGFSSKQGVRMRS